MEKKAKCILVVDDDPLVLWLMDHALQSDGFQVMAATDGIDALKQLRNRQTSVDMALIDVMMPRMSGKKLAQELLQTCPEIKIMFMSGYGPDIMSDEPSLMQTYPLLGKPFDFSRLLRKIHAELETSSGESVGE
jgi:two-component system cell cycle sensor histidine kinase/response regulator CckA